MNLRYYLRTLISIIRRRPFILYHKPTLSCNCKCKFCDFWQQSNGKDDSLPTDIIIKMLEDGADMGFSTYTLWGGEPLIAEDVGIWLEKAKELGYKTTMCTAGYLIEERIRDISENLDIMLLSLEATGSKQDSIRRTPDLFSKIERGIELLREEDVFIKIWCNVSALNKDEVFDVVKFARNNDIIVEFFPANIMSEYNKGIIFDAAEKYRVFTDIMHYKRQGYPINNSWSALKIMRDSKPFICNMPKNGILIEQNGDLMPCEPRIVNRPAYGNITDGLKKSFSESTYRANIDALKHCNKCMLPCVVESVDSMLLQSFKGAMQSIMKGSR